MGPRTASGTMVVLELVGEDIVAGSTAVPGSPCG